MTWYSIKDRTPERRDCYLVAMVKANPNDSLVMEAEYCSDEKGVMGWWIGGIWGVGDYECGEWTDEVTHWAEMPEPPS